MRVPALCAVLLGCVSIAAAADTHPFSVHDMLAMDRISDPRVSPDGTPRRLRGARRPTSRRNRGRTDLWLAAHGRRVGAPADDARGQRHRGRAGRPTARRIYFLSTRSGSRAGVAAARSTAARPSRSRACRSTWTRSRSRPTARRCCSRWRSSPARRPAETQKRARTRKAEGEGQRAALRPALRPALGHLGATARATTSSPIRFAGGEARRPDDGDGRRLPGASPSAAARSSPSRPTARRSSSRRATSGREEAWSTNFDLFARAASTARPRPRKLTHEPGLGHAARVLARRQDARLPGHEPRRATRPTASASCCATGRRARSGRSTCAPTDGRAATARPRDLAWSRGRQELYADRRPPRPAPALRGRRRRRGKARIVVGDGHDREPAAGRATASALRAATRCWARPSSTRSAATGGDVKRVTQLNDAKVAAARFGEPEQFTLQGRERRHGATATS